MQSAKKVLFYAFFICTIKIICFCSKNSDFSEIAHKICEGKIDLFAKIMVTNNRLGDSIIHEWARLPGVGNYEASEVERALHAKDLPAVDMLQNFDGDTPLHIVCSGKFLNFFKFKALANWGIPLDVQNFQHQTILHRLAESGPNLINHKVQILNYFKKRDLSEFINVRDIYGRTALHLAIQNGDIKVFDFLMSFRDVDVNARDKNNDTPLHYAAKKMQTSPEDGRYFIDNLIRARASISKKNNNGVGAYKFVPKQFHRIRNRLKY